MERCIHSVRGVGTLSKRTRHAGLQRSERSLARLGLVLLILRLLLLLAESTFNECHRLVVRLEALDFGTAEPLDLWLAFLPRRVDSWLAPGSNGIELALLLRRRRRNLARVAATSIGTVGHCRAGLGRVLLVG